MPVVLEQFIRDNLDGIIFGLMVSAVALALAALLLYSRLGRLHRVYTRLTRNTSGGNVEEILHEHMSTVGTVTERLDRLEKALEAVALAQRSCVQKVGLVRFDAFEEVGGQQSFAAALLDADKSGVVISSVYSRRDMRVYAKSMTSGKPNHPLTEEEREAVSEAESR